MQTSDTDGFTSASILYHYIKTNLHYNNIKYILQTGKQHGLSEYPMNILLSSPIGLVITPDASTNDVEQCKILVEQGFDVLVLDHHQKEIDENKPENTYATIINNQTCDYPNKNLCGVGVVYKFLQALDDEYWVQGADEYLDLVALGNIADIMDLRECETKHLVDIGLKNIKHPLLKAFLKKQSFSIPNIERPTMTNISFYITPMINAMIRLGKFEEKDLLFKAFAMEYNEFEYKPRKSKNNPNPTLIMESIFDRAARLCYNTKVKQSKIQAKAVQDVVDVYDAMNKQNAMCFINASRFESISNEFTGLVAIKIASEYGKPCLIIRKDNSKSNDSKIIFSGSARNINDGFIKDLKKELEDSGLFENVIGHANAFGVSIQKNNVPRAIEFFNNKYKDIDTYKKYSVDFVVEENVEYSLVKGIYEIQHLFSNFVREPLIAINNIHVDLMGFSMLGSEGKHWKFQNGMIEYIRFNAGQHDFMMNLDTFSTESVVLNVVGKASINQYGSKVTPQVIIESYEVVSVE